MKQNEYSTYNYNKNLSSTIKYKICNHAQHVFKKRGWRPEAAARLCLKVCCVYMRIIWLIIWTLKWSLKFTTCKNLHSGAKCLLAAVTRRMRFFFQTFFKIKTKVNHVFAFSSWKNSFHSEVSLVNFGHFKNRIGAG